MRSARQRCAGSHSDLDVANARAACTPASLLRHHPAVQTMEFTDPDEQPLPRRQGPERIPAVAWAVALAINLIALYLLAGIPRRDRAEPPAPISVEVLPEISLRSSPA